MRYFFLCLILLIPGCIHSLNVDIFSVYRVEGFILMVANNGLSLPTPIPTPVEKCTCGGTKVVKSGDGLVNVPCPCGDSCNCKQAEVTKKKRVLYFGQSSSCRWCRKVEKETFPSLKKKKWTIGIGKENLIQIFDVDDEESQKLFDSLDLESLPTFVLLEDEKVVRKLVGYCSPKEFTNFYYGTK